LSVIAVLTVLLIRTASHEPTGLPANRDNAVKGSAAGAPPFPENAASREAGSVLDQAVARIFGNGAADPGEAARARASLPVSSPPPFDREMPPPDPVPQAKENGLERMEERDRIERESRTLETHLPAQEIREDPGAFARMADEHSRQEKEMAETVEEADAEAKWILEKEAHDLMTDVPPPAGG
jgi:hypothetical protein